VLKCFMEHPLLRVGFGMGLLGAVAGVADQPIRLLAQDDRSVSYVGKATCFCC